MYNNQIKIMTTLSKKTMMNIKIDSGLKKRAQKVAESFGLPLSTVVARKLEEFVESESLIFKKPLVPNKKTAKLIKESIKNYEEWKKENFSGPFYNVEDAISHLKNL